MKPLTVLYPQHCLVCRKLIAEQDHGLCASCRAMTKAEMCSLVYKTPDHVDRLVCAVRYSGGFRRAITNFKFHQQRAYAKPLAELMIQAWDMHGMHQPNIITYVPISTFRAYTRGFNQSKELANLLAEAWNIPVVSTLRRKNFSRRQSELCAKDRWKNAEKAFFPCSNIDLHGKTVLLIDDIVTTGATINSCSVHLKQMGAHTVWVLAAAKTC